MGKWTKLRDRALATLLKLLGIGGRDAPETPESPEAAEVPEAPEAPEPRERTSAPPAWDECVHASCWGGANASERMMNMLSPKMDNAKFEARLAAMKKRGADTAHLILVNKADGECSGYSPWGKDAAPRAASCDPATASHMRARIDRIAAEGMAVVVWLTTDDGADWAKALAANAERCLLAVAQAGLLDEASTVVLGLEMDEYWDKAQAKAVAAAARKVYGGKLGTHHTSGRTDFAALGDLIFYQVQPGRSAAQIKADTAAAKKAGKPVNFFELSRGPDRALCEAALSAGAFGVGNW